MCYIKFTVDTGWTNLLPLDFYYKLTILLQQNHYKRIQVCIYLPIMDPKYSTFVYASQVHFKSKCFVVNFYVVGKSKAILGLESSRKHGLIYMQCTVEKSTNFGKAQPANHAKAQTTHPLPSRSDS